MTPLDADGLLSASPFGLAPDEKQGRLVERLNALTTLHRDACPEYRRVIERLFPSSAPATTLEEVPYLPVGVFKSHVLRSIPQEAVFKTLRSSGTTGTASRIELDRDTATRQTKALASIMTSVLGPQRLPMIIIDAPNLVRDRKSFSARGAGVLGMMNFGRDHFYALNDAMELDREGLARFLSKHAGQPLFLFGFTFMVWRYFLQQLPPGEFDLSRGVLVHGGGWKKLGDEAVTRAEFRRAFQERTGLARVHDYYGMVEQVGNIYLECEEGYFHTPAFSDVIVRDPLTWRPAEPGREGVLQVLSVLPTSYPGHSILTEDLGSLVAHDRCRCGRRGTHFLVHGRVPASAPRGCSDTFVPPPSEAP